MNDSRARRRSWMGRAAMLLFAAPAITLAQVTEIEFQPATIFVRAGQTRLVRVGLKPQRYTPRDVDWSVQDESVVRVDGAGGLTAIRAGRTNVYARAGVHGEANEMGRVIVFDDGNSTKLALPGGDGPLPATLKIEFQQPSDDIVALVCRVRTDAIGQPVLKVRMDDGPELEVNAAGTAGEGQDVSPMFMHPFGGFYRYGLTAGKHTLTLTPLARGLRIEDVRLVGETNAHDHYGSHASAVMGERRWYRIFLPPDYDATHDRLPVVYYLHGWGGRVFKEGVPGSHIDRDELERRVARDRVIAVMTDGQVFWEGGMQFSRFAPYNIFLPRESAFLWEDYFAEFVRHIDETYRTIPDRSSRALLGFSMGGLMSYRIAERYPHLVGAVNPLCGATEGYFGTPADTIYVQVADMVENLHGVRLRIHDTASDYLLGGNERVWQAAQREELPDTEIVLFPGAHAVDPAGGRAGFTQAFDWAVESFRHPQPPPERWHSLQFVPKFDGWDYRVASTPAKYGFTELHGVTPGGFRVATLTALPDGTARPGATVTIETAPRYLPDTDYEVFDYDETKSAAARTSVRSDGVGRIKLTVDGEPHQIGLHRAGDPAEVVALSGLAGSRGFLPVGRETTLTIKLLNRGANAAHGLRGFVACALPGVTIAQPDFTIAALAPGEVAEVSVPVVARIEPPVLAQPFAMRFAVKVHDDSGASWRDELDVVPFYDVPKLDVTVEGDGGRSAAAAGGTVVLRANGRPLRVYPDDPYVRKLADEPVIVANDPENAAAFSRLQIAPDCPHGHVVKCLVRMETVRTGDRSVVLQWGRAEFTVP